MWAIEWSRDRRRHVTLKGQTCDPNSLKAQYLENYWARDFKFGMQFVWGMPSGRTKISPKSGRGLGHVTSTIFGSTVGYPSDSLASCCLNLHISHGDMKENVSGCFFLNTVNRSFDCLLTYLLSVSVSLCVCLLTTFSHCVSTFVHCVYHCLLSHLCLYDVMLRGFHSWNATDGVCTADQVVVSMSPTRIQRFASTTLYVRRMTLSQGQGHSWSCSRLRRLLQGRSVFLSSWLTGLRRDMSTKSSTSTTPTGFTGT